VAKDPSFLGGFILVAHFSHLCRGYGQRQYSGKLRPGHDPSTRRRQDGAEQELLVGAYVSIIFFDSGILRYI